MNILGRLTRSAAVIVAGTALWVSAPAQADTVCMVGDSIVKRGLVWRGEVQKLRGNTDYLGNYFDGVYFHDGVGGDSTADVLARIDGVPACDIALVHVGGNDLAKQQRGPAAIASNLRTIADILASKGARVYISTILPCNDCGTDPNLVIAFTNMKIKEAAGPHPVIDSWQAFTKSGFSPDLLYVDAVHPSAFGYLVLARYHAPRWH